MSNRPQKNGIFGRLAGMINGTPQAFRREERAPVPNVAIIELNTLGRLEVTMGTFLEIPSHQEPATLGDYYNYFHPYQGDGATTIDDEAGS